MQVTVWELVTNRAKGTRTGWTLQRSYRAERTVRGAAPELPCTLASSERVHVSGFLGVVISEQLDREQ